MDTKEIYESKKSGAGDMEEGNGHFKIDHFLIGISKKASILFD
jgi:hypothetical protein